MINTAIKQLVTYGLENNLINKRDINYITNKILEVLGLKEYIEPAEEFKNVSLEDTVSVITDNIAQSPLVSDELVVLVHSTGKVKNDDVEKAISVNFENQKIKYHAHGNNKYL